jgi:extracellular matrix regulatory protein B
MFVHLGEDILINSKRIIAIINAENSMGANSTKEFLKTAQEKGFVQKISKEYASIVITDKTIYLSPISSYTLKKRAGFIDELENNLLLEGVS